MELDQLCQVLAEAECERLAACGALSAPVDGGACLIRQREVWCGRLEAEARRLIAASEVEFDRAAAARCRDEIKAAGCAAGLRASPLQGPECRALWTALVMEAGACSSSLSCAGNLACVVSQECPGTCQRALGTNLDCGFDRFCDDANFCSLTALRCRQRVARDQSCEEALSGNACEDGSWCDLAQLGGGRCTAAGGRGFACTTPYQCAAGLFCFQGRCSAGLEDDGCANEGQCRDGRICAAGRCRTPIAQGAPCVPAEAACAEGAVCRGEEAEATCQAQSGPQGPCEAASDCYLGRCQGGRCAAFAADGAECESAQDCMPGRTCDGAVCRVTDTCFL